MTHGVGWVGHYCFSYDEHYDPQNLSFGRLLACNEFVLEPGAGFGRHRHAGIDVVTTVLDGVLTHVTPTGLEERGPGSYVLRTGGGMEHDERNGTGRLVRFVQAWFPAGEGAPPAELAVRPGESVTLAGRAFALVVEGTADLGGAALARGDSARVEPGEVELTGLTPAVLLAWDC
ncbi:MAG TPA: pirin family protein [Mycobacteriales bacterium]|nr:pirin family protein [Mycobacteriales bacterium]